MRVISTIGAALLVAAPAFAQPANSPPPESTPPMVLYNPTVQPPLSEALPSSPYWPGVESPERSRLIARSEQALRHQIEAIEAGRPDYAVMTTKTANQLRFQLNKIQPSLVRQWGAFLSLERRPTSGGNDYEAKFERARVWWQVKLDAKGLIAGIAFKTLS
jgi:hypothetical protein